MSEKVQVDVNLYDLAVTDDPTDFFGRVRAKGKLDNRAIADRIKKEGSEYQVETLVEILNRADRIKAEALASGYNINTSFMNARLAISGVFYSSAFDPEQQKLGALFTPASHTRNLIKNTSVNVLGEAQTGIVILKAVDSLTGAANSTITPNNVLVITGDRLQIESDEANTDKVGVFFINTTTNEATKATQIISNKNKELIVMVPNLPQGDYELKVVTQGTNGSNLLKEPREEVLDSVLTVE
nr:DNA-binding domain-containing protein [uncultured Carboxylicivirga sp.]